MSMSHPFFPLIAENSTGRFFFTPCPGTKDVGLHESLEQLATAGAAAIVTLMPHEEMQRNAVTDLPELCQRLGLEWYHLPIEDDHAPGPEFAAAWVLARSKIHMLLDAGKTIAIHCKGGTGRTGLVIAVILIERGLPLDEVIARVRAARPNALKISAQLEYLHNFARQIVATGNPSAK